MYHSAASGNLHGCKSDENDPYFIFVFRKDCLVCESERYIYFRVKCRATGLERLSFPFAALHDTKRRAAASKETTTTTTITTLTETKPKTETNEKQQRRQQQQ